ESPSSSGSAAPSPPDTPFQKWGLGDLEERSCPLSLPPRRRQHKRQGPRGAGGRAPHRPPPPIPPFPPSCQTPPPPTTPLHAPACAPLPAATGAPPGHDEPLGRSPHAGKIPRRPAAAARGGPPGVGPTLVRPAGPFGRADLVVLLPGQDEAAGQARRRLEPG